MIFVTVGSMFPFDRLIRAVDALAAELPEETFFAQIGQAAYEPANMAFARSLSPGAFSAKVDEARLVIAHAGMGSVISAMESRKPMVLLPRLASQGEVTTDHQTATAKWLADKPGLHIAPSEDGLKDVVLRALRLSAEGDAAPRAEAPAAFLEKIRNYILA